MSNWLIEKKRLEYEHELEKQYFYSFIVLSLVIMPTMFLVGILVGFLLPA